ncbi:MAG: hypothetical protein HY652_00650 [Acidobacteria bacterium]|nr:hypothetical protein [Acidobacteriota bacterium]
MQEPLGNLGYEVCRCLRWKGMFIDAEPDPTVPPCNDRLFWCMHTQTCLGPDGQVAEPEQCKPGRGCYDRL